MSEPSGDRFWYQGRQLARFDHMYNSTYFSERGVELAVVGDFLGRTSGELLEVGNVLQHYRPEIDVPDRMVVDLYEVADGVTNIDIFKVEGAFDRIIAISTLEHVGLDYGEAYDETASNRAIQFLRSRLTPEGRMLVTFPIGWHPTLDPETLDPDTSSYYYRNSPLGYWTSEWTQAETLSEVPDKKKPYGLETPWATALWIGEFGYKTL